MDTKTASASGTVAQASKHDVDSLNSLLRGELSAVETYNQAIEKFTGESQASELRSIRTEHTHAVETLQNRIRQYGGEASTGSGTWGTFATTVTGAAKLLGPKTVLSALKQGEEHGVNVYLEALGDTKVSEECRYLIRSELMPPCKSHIAALDGMIAGFEKK